MAVLYADYCDFLLPPLSLDDDNDDPDRQYLQAMQKVRDEYVRRHQAKQENLVAALVDESALWITEKNIDEVRGERIVKKKTGGALTCFFLSCPPPFLIDNRKSRMISLL